MDPKDYRTWTSFADHPIFGKDRCNVERWSYDARRYCELGCYGAWKAEGYIHVDPAPSQEFQSASAKQDINSLSRCCLAIEQEFGSFTHELIVLDDFTVYVWIAGSCFELDIYPNNILEPDYRFLLLLNRPIEVDEVRCSSISDVVETLRRVLNMGSSDGRPELK